MCFKKLFVQVSMHVFYNPSHVNKRKCYTIWISQCKNSWRKNVLARKRLSAQTSASNRLGNKTSLHQNVWAPKHLGVKARCENVIDPLSEERNFSIGGKGILLGGASPGGVFLELKFTREITSRGVVLLMVFFSKMGVSYWRCGGAHKSQIYTCE